MKFSDGKWVEEEAHKFHMAAKNKLREFFCSDLDNPNLDALIEMPMNDRWAMCEAGDGGFVKNEDFIAALVKNYLEVMKNYGPDEKEEIIAPKMAKYALALYRNDSAYFERMGGIITFVVKNKDKFSKIANADQEHSKLLEGVYRWWKTNDKRKRTKPWISFLFKYLIKKYKVNMFYRRSINMAIIFVVQNSDHWKDDPTYDPENWFPKKRGKLANAIFGGFF